MDTTNPPEELAWLYRLLEDPQVIEILVDDYQHVYVSRNDQLVDVPSPFVSEAHYMQALRAIFEPMGQRVDESHPIVDVRLPDGVLVHAVIPPIALDGPSLTIRRFIGRVFTPQELVGFHSWSQAMADFLQACVVGGVNILVAGGVGSGKTTVLNVLARMIPNDERILVGQHYADLKLEQPRVVRLETRPANLEGRGEVSMRQLVQSMQRMRPDRIVVSELLGGEALDLLNAISTGIGGSMASIHANSVRDALTRLETLAGNADPTIPLLNLWELIASAVQLITYQERLPDGTRKLLKISELVGLQDAAHSTAGALTTRDIFEYRRDQRQFTASGNLPTFLPALRQRGVDVPLDLFIPADAPQA